MTHTEFMEGRADSRVEVQGQIGIEVLVGRHEDWRKRVVEATLGEDGAEEPDPVMAALNITPALERPVSAPKPELEPFDVADAPLPVPENSGNDDE